MFSVGRAVVALGAVLLLAGCTAPFSGAEPSPSPDQPAAEEPVSEPMPTPSPSIPGSEYVVVDATGFGLHPGSGARPIESWAAEYCALAGLSPCSGIADRGVALCIERWDCHPALLVEFEQGIAAFVSGGIFPRPVVFAIWRGEGDPDLAAFGGPRELLEAYLLTVGVCPDQGGGEPRGPSCPP